MHSEASASRLASTTALSTCGQAHRQGTFPRQLIPEIAELGIFGANIDGYGCAGMNNVSYGLIMQVHTTANSNL